MKEQLEDAIAELGGEPLEGSRFEGERPEGQPNYVSENQEKTIDAK